MGLQINGQWSWRIVNSARKNNGAYNKEVHRIRGFSFAKRSAATLLFRRTKTWRKRETIRFFSIFFFYFLLSLVWVSRISDYRCTSLSRAVTPGLPARIILLPVASSNHRRTRMRRTEARRQERHRSWQRCSNLNYWWISEKKKCFSIEPIILCNII